MRKFSFLTFSALALTLFCSSTLEEKAAKMLIVGMKGTALTEENPVIDDITKKGVAGVIFFEHNIASKEAFKGLISDLKKLRQDKILFAIDQEGGKVNRTKEKYGFKPMLSAKEVGSAKGKALAKENAAIIASELSEVGINLNFAPCVDVNINPQCPVIGAVSRSFSHDEKRVADLAKIYVQEHHKKGILTSLKHFPGHGSSLKDSHLGFTDISSTWQKRELYPYLSLMREKLCDMVMVSHLYNKNIDPKHPATLSKATIDSLLRHEMGWDGVVVSDDMQMKAITDHYSFEKGIIMGINAGVDLFIISSNISATDYIVSERFIKTVVEAVKKGEISAERIDKSVERIEKLLK